MGLYFLLMMGVDPSSLSARRACHLSCATSESKSINFYSVITRDRNIAEDKEVSCLRKSAKGSNLASMKQIFMTFYVNLEMKQLPREASTPD
ncbi:hypothetical protein M8J75_015998 [Diaphorina citri]|nr:hypothetical protein M8J75_015998 [Diaphorina citri]